VPDLPEGGRTVSQGAPSHVSRMHFVCRSEGARLKPLMSPKAQP